MVKQGFLCRREMRERWRARSRRSCRDRRTGRTCASRRVGLSKPSAPGRVASPATRTSIKVFATSISAWVDVSSRPPANLMCGIYGVLQLEGGPASAESLRRMGAMTIHRGPDDEGIHVDGAAAIGMRRLSIIDLAGGHQPLSNEDGSLWLVANGEIYNYRELRSELLAAGYRFKTESD